MNEENLVTNISENEYSELLNTAITQIQTGRNTLALQVSTTVSSVYWNLGKLLHDKKIENGYGSKIIDRLSSDLKLKFPDMGLSPRNLRYMKRFYERYFDVSQKLQRSVAILFWRQNILFLEKKLSVVANFATTAKDGKTYQVEYYNLDKAHDEYKKYKAKEADRLSFVEKHFLESIRKLENKVENK